MFIPIPMTVRTIAIIAHVDHGKTTLVDELLKQSGTIQYTQNTPLIMDNNDQERER
jgi:GTP-binding protein